MRRPTLVIIALAIIGGFCSGSLMANEHNDESGVTTTRDIEAHENNEEQATAKKADVEMSREIRREIMAHNELSPEAYWVKVSTHNGVVTLRGKLRRAQDRQTIAQIAREFAGTGNLRNELQILPAE